MNPGMLAWMPGPIEWAIIGVVALLIFGRRLPEVARSVGKSIVEFKRGIRDVKDEVETRSRLESPPKSTLEGPAPPERDKPTIADSSAGSNSSSGPTPSVGQTPSAGSSSAST